MIRGFAGRTYHIVGNMSRLECYNIYHKGMLASSFFSRKVSFSHQNWWHLPLLLGAQWLSGRVLDSRLKGRGFEPHRRHCVVVLEQDTFFLA